MSVIPPPVGGIRTQYEQSLEREIDRLEQAVDALLAQVEDLVAQKRELLRVIEQSTSGGSLGFFD